MKLTPELLQKIVDDCGIDNQSAEFNEAMVIQCKMACSIYNQAPATDESTIEWLNLHADDLNFCHSQLAVKCKDGTHSYYDYKETDDVLRVALHYGLCISSRHDEWYASSNSIAKIVFMNENPALAIMGCIAQLDGKAHAYAS